MCKFVIFLFYPGQYYCWCYNTKPKSQEDLLKILLVSSLKGFYSSFIYYMTCCNYLHFCSVFFSLYWKQFRWVSFPFRIIDDAISTIYIHLVFVSNRKYPWLGLVPRYLSGSLSVKNCRAIWFRNFFFHFLEKVLLNIWNNWE